MLTPLGNRGNYFGRQNRSARRTEWLETLSLAPLRLAGTHLVKTGASLTASSDAGQFTYRSIDILNAASQPLERIDFSNRNPFSRNDLEVSSYGQDHWSLNSKIAFDFGARLEHQKLASRFRIAPRVGLAWTLSTTSERYSAPAMASSTTIFRSTSTRSGFAPRGATWNLQVEHSFAPFLRVRAVYTANRSVGLLVLEPALLDDVNEVLLNGNGRSRHRQAELTAKFAWKDSQQLVLSYVRSRSQGNLNTFDTFLGNFPTPLLRPAVYSNLPADLPNRFLMWGRVQTHVWSLTALPIVEYRNGFPYARLDEFQNYAGIPNTGASRFPRFFSAGARLMRDFKVSPKYAVRLSLTTFNITNHTTAATEAISKSFSKTVVGRVSCPAADVPVGRAGRRSLSHRADTRPF